MGEWTRYHTAAFFLTFTSFALYHAERRTISYVKASIVKEWTPPFTHKTETCQPVNGSDETVLQATGSDAERVKQATECCETRQYSVGNGSYTSTQAKESNKRDPAKFGISNSNESDQKPTGSDETLTCAIEFTSDFRPGSFRSGPTLFEDVGSAEDFLGVLNATFLFVYAVGLYFSGVLAERMDLRRLLATGMVLSATVLFIFGPVLEWTDGRSKTAYVVLMVASGLTQSTGLPCVVAITGNWFSGNGKGHVIALTVWGTSASIGSILGAFMVSAVVQYGYEYGFLVTTSVTVSAAILICAGIVAHPSEVGLALSKEVCVDVVDKSDSANVDVATVDKRGSANDLSAARIPIHEAISVDEDTCSNRRRDEDLRGDCDVFVGGEDTWLIKDTDSSVVEEAEDISGVSDEEGSGMEDEDITGVKTKSIMSVMKAKWRREGAHKGVSEKAPLLKPSAPFRTATGKPQKQHKKQEPSPAKHRHLKVLYTVENLDTTKGCGTKTVQLENIKIDKAANRTFAEINWTESLPGDEQQSGNYSDVESRSSDRDFRADSYQENYLQADIYQENCAVSQENTSNETDTLQAETNSEKPIGFVQALLLPGVLPYTLAWFFLKPVDGIFFFWLPFYLSSVHEYPEWASDQLSVWFEVGAMLGCVATAVMFARWNKRAVVIAPMLGTFVPVLYLYSKLPSGQPTVVHAAVLFVLGFLTASLTKSMAAIYADLGKEARDRNVRAVATIAGIAEGTSTVGAALGQLALPWLSVDFGWDSVFYMMMLCTALSVVCLLPVAKTEIMLCTALSVVCLLPVAKTEIMRTKRSL